MENVAISQNIIQPIIFSNIQYVNSIEEFENIELQYNEAKLCFDNFRQCFYIRSRDNHGKYSSTDIYFYDGFATRMQSDSEREFYEKCRKLKLDSLKTEIAYKFFMENEKPMAVWLWLLKTKKADWEEDTVKRLKCELKKKFLSLGM